MAAPAFGQEPSSVLNQLQMKPASCTWAARANNKLPSFLAVLGAAPRLRKAPVVDADLDIFLHPIAVQQGAVVAIRAGDVLLTGPFFADRAFLAYLEQLRDRVVTGEGRKNAAFPPIRKIKTRITAEHLVVVDRAEITAGACEGRQPLAVLALHHPALVSPTYGHAFQVALAGPEGFLLTSAAHKHCQQHNQSDGSMVHVPTPSRGLRPPPCRFIRRGTALLAGKRSKP